MNPNRWNLRHRKAAGITAGLILAGTGGWFLVHREASLPPPQPAGHWIEVQGLRIAGQALQTADGAKQAFGFDIRGAGLLPIRLAIEHRGKAVAGIDAPQTFLVDREGLAWPLLTAAQARARLPAAVESEATGHRAAAAYWKNAPETLTGFALDLGIRGAPDPDLDEGSPYNSWWKMIRGLDAPAAEMRVRERLTRNSLRNPSLGAGQAVEGYLLFPGRADEAKAIAILRLGLAMDGEVRVVEIPAEDL